MIQFNCSGPDSTDLLFSAILPLRQDAIVYYFSILCIAKMFRRMRECEGADRM